MTEMYILDICEHKDVHMPHSILAEQILLHNDIIRGYTVVRTTMDIYLNQLKRTIGDYVDIIVRTYDIPDDINKGEYGELALKIHNSDPVFRFGSTMPEITVNCFDNGGYYAYTESMLEYSCECSEFYDFLVPEIAVLFDNVFNYIRPMKTDNMINFKQFILDGLIYVKQYLFNDEGNYTIDPYYNLKLYQDYLLYTGYDVRREKYDEYMGGEMR